MSKFSAKIKSLPKADKVLIGQRVTSDPSKNGHICEDLLEQAGYHINRGKGPDIKNIGVEVKNRTREATSAQTIGKMKFDDIINASWEKSVLFEKSQTIYKIITSREEGIIVSTKILEYSKPHVQEKLRESYEQCRKILKDIVDNNLPLPKYVKNKDCWGYFENTQENTRPGWYDFRFGKGNAEKLDGMARSNYNVIFNEQ